MRLTEAGETAYEWAKEVMGRSHEMVRKIEGFAAGDSGRAVVAASMNVGSYLLPAVKGAKGRRKRIAAFSIDDLTAEEEEELLKYLAFLRSRKGSA